MTTPFQVRRARPADHDAVAELTGGVYVAEGWSSASYEPVLRDVASRAAQATVLVAVEPGGELLGAVTVATRGGPYAEQAGPEDAVMRMLVTSPQARGRGVGTALVQACLDAAVADGCVRLRLSTQPEMAAAHRLYARHGFVATPDGDWSPEPGLLLLAYALDLPVFCGRCGERLEAGAAHPACAVAGALEPPRYCARCRRRMVVQVTPTGWTARCVEHGASRSAG